MSFTTTLINVRQGSGHPVMRPACPKQPINRTYTQVSATGLHGVARRTQVCVGNR